MGRPYSMDLRKRVVSAIAGGLSRRQAAKQFDVSASAAIDWMRRMDTGGSAAPGQIGGHKPRKIAGEHRVWLIERCRNGAFTLRGLVTELADRGLKVDRHTVWDFVHAEGLSFKKNTARQRAGSSRRDPPSHALAKASRQA